MRTCFTNRPRATRGRLAVATTAVVLASACSLTLPGEDAYLGALDGGLDAGPASPDGGENPGLDGAAFPDGPADTGALVGDAGSDARVASDSGGGADAGGADGDTDAALPPAVLELYYPFEDVDGGATVRDESGKFRDGTLKSDAPTPVLPLLDPLGHAGHGLVLDGNSKQFVQLPSEILNTMDAMSVACWINLKTAAVWNRLFDFNDGSTVWAYFSPTGWNPNTGQPGTHFALSSGTHLDPEMVLTDTLTPGTWHHVAVVLARPYLVYYLDGVEKARLGTMTLAPKDIHATQLWLGKSAYFQAVPPDPYLTATLDEFRLYSGALTSSQVAQLASQ